MPIIPFGLRSALPLFVAASLPVCSLLHDPHLSQLAGQDLWLIHDLASADQLLAGVNILPCS